MPLLLLRPRGFAQGQPPAVATPVPSPPAPPAVICQTQDPRSLGLGAGGLYVGSRGGVTTPITASPPAPPALLCEPPDWRVFGLANGSTFQSAREDIGQPIPLTPPTNVAQAADSRSFGLGSGVLYTGARGGVDSVPPSPPNPSNIRVVPPEIAFSPFFRDDVGLGRGRFIAGPQNRTIPIIPTGVQPPQYRAMAENAPPAPGMVLQNKPLVDSTGVIPRAVPSVFARAESAPSYPGGFVRAIGGVDSKSLIPAVTRVILASAESPPPAAGRLTTAIGGITSGSTLPPPPPAVFARQEPPQPAPGVFVSIHGAGIWFPRPQPSQIFRTEERQPAAGSTTIVHAVPGPTQQTKGMSPYFAYQESPRPGPGFVAIAGIWRVKRTITSPPRVKVVEERPNMFVTRRSRGAKMQVVQLQRGPEEDRNYGASFYQWAEILAGDLLASATINVVTPGIIVGLPTIDSTKTIVLFEVSGGTQNTTYRLELVATTMAGAKLEVFINVNVVRPA